MSNYDEYRDQGLELASLRCQLAHHKSNAGAEINRLRRLLTERAEMAERNHMIFERAARKDMIKIAYLSAFIGFMAGVGLTVYVI